MAATTQNHSMMHSSLYVGDLHPLTTETILHSKFLEIGPVLSARICRDLASRASLGYGYVNFQERQHAERAMEALNYEPIMGRPIRLMWSQRDPSLRKSGKGNIFIKNLDKSIEQKQLYDTFSYFGPILSCKIAIDENGNSKGYGFVHFETEENAEKAIEQLNKMMICDKVVYVGKFIPKAERKSQARKMRFNNIYVKNFPPETDDAKLHEMFSEFGEIKSACVMKDAEGKSKGFGFVCFIEAEHAENAVKSMHNRDYGGRPLFACRAQKKEERQEELRQRLEKQRAERQSRYVSNVNLYVKNLDDGIDDKRLKEAFSSFGEITSAKVMLDANSRSKGFGFVCFTHADQAAKAVTDMNGTLVGSKPLYVALAQRKEDRRAKLWAEHQQRVAHYRSTVGPMIPAVTGHAAAAHNYFPPTAFQQAQRYYHSTNAVLGSQSRWNRATAMPTGIAAQLGVANRPPMAGHYINAPNPTAGMVPNQMAAFAQMRSPAGVGRQMVPGAMPSMPTGHHLPAGAVLNQAANQQRQQVSGRQGIGMQQVLAAPAANMNQRPSMASVVANPNVRPMGQQVARAVMHSVMPNMPGSGGNVRFNQTARNVSTQPLPVPQNNMSTVLAPLGDQSPLTISALAHMPEEEQKRMLGERLFPLIKQMFPDLARKLTGMLLGVDNAEVIHLLDSKESLRAKCEEGINVLKNSCNLVDESDASGIVNNAPGQNGDGTNNSEVKPDMTVEASKNGGDK